MYDAYSMKEQRRIFANEARNMDEVYLCPEYPRCKAELKLRSVDGNRQVHFYNPPNAVKHIAGCRAVIQSKYRNIEHVVKTPVEAIMNNYGNSSTNNRQSTRIDRSGKSDTIYVKTTRSLLDFCLAHTDDTEYLDGGTVGDIFVSERNILHNGQFQGFDGIRLLYGYVEDLKEAHGTIIMRIYSRPLRNGKVLTFHATARTNPAFVHTVLEYLIATHPELTNPPRFVGVGSTKCPIAILADWKRTCDFKVSCEVKNVKCVLYKSPSN